MNKTALALGIILLFSGVGYWYAYSSGLINPPDGGSGPVAPPPVQVTVQAWIWMNGAATSNQAARVYVNATSTYEEDDCVTQSPNPTIPLRPTITYNFIITTYVNFTGISGGQVLSQLTKTLTLPNTLSSASIIKISVSVAGIIGDVWVA